MADKKQLGDCLDEAKALINGERQKDYGRPDDNINTIALFWSGYLSQLTGGVVYLTGRDVCNMQSLLKIARDIHTPKHDNCVDVAGYIAISDFYFGGQSEISNQKSDST